MKSNRLILPSEITTKEQYFDRRKFIASLGSVFGCAMLPASTRQSGVNSAYTLSTLDEPPNSLNQITRYNNYYEFSTNKEAVHVLAQELTTNPWTITIDGEVDKPVTIGLEDILSKFTQEERIYRLRCVEGWSMVIPWSGFSLSKLLKTVTPTSKAKFVEFKSLLRPKEMIGQRRGSLSWPYTEGLRIDEAMHPLTILATGLYGNLLPKQNGAPIRLVVPWKYGFKSSKAITHIRLTEKQPATSWQLAAPSEYGFYGNVNPEVAHPRWSQKRENRIGELRKRRTLPFNGYAEQVSDLYSGLNLVENY